MNKEQSSVVDFHRVYGTTINTEPTVCSEDDSILRILLINEEAREVVNAILKKDINEIAKELADLLYVTYGAAVTYGLDIAPIFAAVHDSNMNKFWDCVICHGTGKYGTGENCGICEGTGKIIRHDDVGKVIKPPHYKSPDLSGIIEKQCQVKNPPTTTKSDTKPKLSQETLPIVEEGPLGSISMSTNVATANIGTLDTPTKEIHHCDDCGKKLYPQVDTESTQICGECAERLPR